MPSQLSAICFTVSGITALNQELKSLKCVQVILNSCLRVLAKIGDSRSLNDLLQALEDSDDGVRREAVKALSQIGDGRAVAGLLQALKDDAVFAAAVFALGVIGGEQALNGLLPILRSEYADIRRIAVTAMGNLVRKPGQKPSSEIFHSGLSSDLPLSSVQELEPTSQAIVLNRLLQTLSQDVNASVRSEAAFALGNIACEPALIGLLQALKDKHRYVRRAAAVVLEKIGDDSVIADLFQVLHDKCREVRELAAMSLLSINGLDSTITYLLRMLEDKNTGVRQRAVCGLGEILDSSEARQLRKSKTRQTSAHHAFNRLCQALRDRNFKVRWLAATSLDSIDREQAVNELLQTLNARRFGVWLSSVSALGIIVLKVFLCLEWSIDLPFSKHNANQRWLDAICSDQSGAEPPFDDILQRLYDKYGGYLAMLTALKKIGINNPEWLSKLQRSYQSNFRYAKYAHHAISPIQERYRFYNYEIEQMALPENTVENRAASVTNIYGGQFGDFVAGDKIVKAKGDYIENQENSSDLPFTPSE
jgi:HEAT repeat protein